MVPEIEILSIKQSRHIPYLVGKCENGTPEHGLGRLKPMQPDKKQYVACAMLLTNLSESSLQPPPYSLIFYMYVAQ